jgi:hypothetical protein
MAASVHELVLNDFECYTDDLSSPGFDPILHAEGIAQRLRWRCSGDQLPALVELLEELRSDADHPLIRDIGNSTGYDWTESAEHRDFFRSLITQTLQFIRTATPDRA